jgi:hypothetical protein
MPDVFFHPRNVLPKEKRKAAYVETSSLERKKYK